MMRHQRRQIDVGQRVAIHDQQFVVWHERECPTRTTGRPQKRRFPRIADRETEGASVTDGRGDGLGPVVQIDDRLGDARLAQPAQDVGDERLTTKR